MEQLAFLQIVLAKVQCNMEVLKMFVQTSLAHSRIHFNLSTVLWYVSFSLCQISLQGLQRRKQDISFKSWPLSSRSSY